MGRELSRARRINRKAVDEEVESQTSELRERYESQFAEARETNSKLEEQERALGQQLEEERAKLEATAEEKERAAAEYRYVIRSYEELKGSVDSRTSDLAIWPEL